MGQQPSTKACFASLGQQQRKLSLNFRITSDSHYPLYLFFCNIILSPPILFDISEETMLSPPILSDIFEGTILSPHYFIRYLRRDNTKPPLNILECPRLQDTNYQALQIFNTNQYWLSLFSIDIPRVDRILSIRFSPLLLEFSMKRPPFLLTQGLDIFAAIAFA